MIVEDMNNSELINQIKQKISRELGNTVDIDVEINTNKYNNGTAIIIANIAVIIYFLSIPDTNNIKVKAIK